MSSMSSRPSAPPTLVDVGRAAGVCASTASMALRDDPRIKAATKQRVRAAAAKLNYVPDPILAALVARRRDCLHEGRRTLANIVVLVDGRWQETDYGNWLGLYLAGVKKGCRELGYQFDVVNIQRDLHTHANPDRLLNSRGIRGLVVLPVYDNNIEVPLDWKKYAAVTVGTPPPGVLTHHVCPNTYLSMALICHKLKALGYRRLGLAHSHIYEERHGFESIGSLYAESFVDARLTVVPPHLPGEEGERAELFDAWVSRHRPDCVLANSQRIYEFLLQAGRRVPEDIGYVSLSCRSGETENFSGIAQHLDTTSEVAVKYIHQMILHGEIGVPEFPVEIKIRPHWVDGDTTRAMPEQGLSTRARKRVANFPHAPSLPKRAPKRRGA